ncbi:MAG: HD domain-containing phosphohydrolase [Bdellovibrionales bacterium]|nr:HD domain-containing phosphohydrolase [Bdellovibrionales bacterium]
MSGSGRAKITVKAVTMEQVCSWVTAPTNLYMKLQDGRFVTVFRTGNVIDQDRLAKYSSKGVTTLFSSEQDLDNMSTADGAFAVATTNSKVDALEKISQTVFDDLLSLGVSEASYNNAKAVSKVVRSMIDKDPKLSDAFTKFQEVSGEEVRHAMMVSAMSTVLCSSMDWIKPSTFENVALGALLHDIGMLSLPKDIQTGDVAAMSPNDRKLFEGHGEAGRALLSQLKTVPDDVVMIVAHHHERSDGSGFPLGLKDIYIHPLARIVGLANELVERFEEDRVAGRATSVRFLVEGLIAAQASKFNRDVMKSLKALLASDALKK